MPVEKTNVSISFKEGLDTKTDDKQLSAGKFVTLENVVFTSVGKFKKRFGYGVIGVNQPITNGNALSAFNDELIAFDGNSVFSYSQSNDKLYNKGNKTAIDLSVQSVIRNSYEQKFTDSAVHSSGFSVYSWTDSSGGVRYSVFDTTTHQAIVSNGLVDSSGSMARVRTIGNYILIFYVSGSNLKYFKIDSTNPTATAAAVTAASNISSFFDCSNFNSLIYVAYSSGSAVNLFTISATLSQSSITTVPDTVTFVTIFPDSTNNAWVSYGSGNSVKYLIRSSNLTTAVLAPTTIETGSAPFANITGIYNSSGVFFYEVAGDTSANQYVKRNTGSVAGSVGTPTVFQRSAGIYSKLFLNGGKSYVVLTHDSPLQPTYFVYNDSGNVVAKVAQDLGGGLNPIGFLSSVNLVSTDVYQFSYLFKDFVQSVSGTVTTQTGVNSAKLTFNAPIVSAVIGSNLNTSGGIVSIYDGQNIVEKSYNTYPEGASVSAFSGGGGLGTGSYEYSAVYEWTDAQGQIHRSAPSIPFNLDTTLNKLYSNGSSAGFLYVASNPNYSDLSRIAPGFQVTGPGLTGDNYYVYNPSTQDRGGFFPGGAGSGQYTFSTGKSFVATSSLGSPVVQIKRELTEYFSANIVAGSFTATLNVPDQIIPNVQIQIAVNGGSGSSYTGMVVSQSGNVVTLDTALPYTANGIQLFAIYTFTGSSTSGSPTLSGTATTASINIGDKFITGGPTRSVTVVSKTSNSLTFDSNYTTTTGSQSASYLFPYRYPTVGEVYVDLSGAFSGSVKIVSVDMVAGTATLDHQANATTTDINFVTKSGNIGNLILPTLRITEKKGIYGNANIGLYRTAVNGNVFYRVNSAKQPIINDPTVDSVSFADTVPDALLIGNEQLYTTGGEFENIAPPAASYIGTYKNRAMVFPAEDGTAVWYTKQVTNNTPVEFNDSFVERTPEKGGSNVVGKQMDDKFIIFKRDFIFVLVGEGPSASGINNDFTDPQLIATETGCSDKKSAVILPTGIIYKSPKGFYLLDRSLSDKYIGADVEAFNQYFVTSANMIESKNEVRFTLSSGDTLVYHYFVGQWDIFKSISAVDAISFQNEFTYLNQNGEIRKENENTFTDNTSFIPIKIETGWVSLAGIQGFQRVHELLILGAWYSPHSVQIDIWNEFGSTPFQTTVIPFLTAPEKYQYRVFFEFQKCETIKIRITELQTSPFGRGFDISAMSLRVGLKTGLEKEGSSASFN